MNEFELMYLSKLYLVKRPNCDYKIYVCLRLDNLSFILFTIVYNIHTAGRPTVLKCSQLMFTPSFKDKVT